MTRLRNLARAVWQYLREVSGENDYARYRARALAQSADPMPPAEFYLSRLRHKYSRISRCC
jgi:putative selenoprotein